MDKLRKYYDDIIDKIDDLIAEDKIDVAIFILKDELGAPYIPEESKQILENKLFQLEADRKYFSQIELYEKLSRENLLEKIVNNNSINIYALTNYLERFSEKIDNNDITIFENALLDRKIKNEDKILLIQNLSYFNVNKSLKYFNRNMNETFLINLSEVQTIINIPLYSEALKIIEDIAFKEPSVLEISNNVLFMIYYYYFPTVPKFDSKNLAKSIFSYISYSLQNTEYEKNEITETIEKILEQQNC